MKNLTTLILIICISIILFSCSSNELTRSIAEKKLQEILKDKFDKLTNESLANLPLNILIQSDSFQDEQQTILVENCKNEGLLTYVYSDYNDEYQNYYHKIFKITLTEKGKEYVIKNDIVNANNPYRTEQVYVKCVDCVFGEITGILQNKNDNKAIVNYTVKFILTPWGKQMQKIQGGFWSQYQGENKSLDDVTIKSKQATFSKYDDGWRAEDVVFP